MIHKYSLGPVVRRVLGGAVMVAALSVAACAPSPQTSGAASQPTATQTNDTCIARSPSTTVYEFPKDDESVEVKQVLRKTVIIVPEELRDKVDIKAQALPVDPEDRPNETKQGSDFRFWVMNPEVCNVDSNEPETEFLIPLTIIVFYEETDLEEGEPPSLFVAAKNAQGVWNAQSLPTVHVPDTRALIAPINTLAPNDPVGGGFP